MINPPTELASDKASVVFPKGITARTGLNLISRALSRPWRLRVAKSQPEIKNIPSTISPENEETDVVHSNLLLVFGAKYRSE